ncbi:DMT family transporter [Acinetobacter rudis]|uniref:DMT family transporter n=1 Tax=Acinetobacter rudis TaxID=632955 RepID=UPI00333FCE01
MNSLLYAAVVFIWGTTWIAIAAQHGEISPVVGVLWRFGMAAAVLFIALLLFKKLKPLTRRDHAFCALQGLCIFGVNFVCFYTAVAYINSGLESVIFSMAVLFNALNSRIFFKQRISANFIPAAVLGLLGMLALFWHDLTATQLQWQTFFAIALCTFGTYCFSLGNMISLRHKQQGSDLLSTTAYAMLYGAVFMGIIALLRGESLVPHMSIVGWSAVMYLSLIGSVAGFTIYFVLISRIGAGPAAYSTLLFPLVALSISTVWEGYVWTTAAVLGVILILLGNYILFSPPQFLNKMLQKPNPS